MTNATELSSPAKPQRATARHRTPDQILGPYYPTGRNPVAQDDLTAIEGASGCALGEIIEIRGQILDLFGKPVRGAKLTIWQANSFGRYVHPNDSGSTPLDPNFLGSATLQSGDHGEYRVKTVKPGAYPAGPDWMRPPHIHFEVQGRFERLITQMYFPDEPLNARDRALMSAPRPDLLIASVALPEERPSYRIFKFDIILSRG